MKPIHWILLGLATLLLAVWAPVFCESRRKRK